MTFPRENLDIPSIVRLKQLLYNNSSDIIQKCSKVNAGHIGGSLSMSQFLLPLLYTFHENNKDYRLVLSKGHASLGLYSILNTLNITNKPFDNYCTLNEGSYHGHTSHKGFEKILISSGSLGHGLPVAHGYAYANSLKNIRDIPVFCIVGDGELQEGTFWETLQHLINIDINLKIIIDYNNSIETNTRPINEIIPKIIDVTFINPTLYIDLISLINKTLGYGLQIFICNTNKVANLTGYENKPRWHAGIPNDIEAIKMKESIYINLK